MLGPEVGDTLTPASLSLGTGLHFPTAQTPSNLLKRKQLVDAAFAEFWHRFVTSPNLNKSFKFSAETDELKVNDIVLILDRPSPLGWFKAGQVKTIVNDRRVLVEIAGGKVLERHKKTLSRLCGEDSR